MRGKQTTPDPDFDLCRWAGCGIIAAMEKTESGWGGAVSAQHARRLGRCVRGRVALEQCWACSVMFEYRHTGCGVHGVLGRVGEAENISIYRPEGKPGTAVGYKGAAYRVGGYSRSQGA